MVQGQRGVYHVMSRTACGHYLFDEEAKGVFLNLVRKQAGFCGIEVLAYCVMDNHFHLLVSVPEAGDMTDAELLRRYRLLYDSKSCPASAAAPEVLKTILKRQDEEGRELRARILARMHDLPVFMRELKQRFGIWYNHRHGNKGTIWAKRFTSVVVEPSREAMTTVAAYIDLNPVRAELVSDPADYPFSSYGRAIGGGRGARAGYRSVFGGEATWDELIQSYNLILYGKGVQCKGASGKDRGRIAGERLTQVLNAGGKLEIPDVLRARVRYFSASTAIGSEDYLSRMGASWRERYDFKRKRDAYPMRYGQWGGLQSYRNLQVRPVEFAKMPE